MTPQVRNDRTVRLLSQRLDELACRLERGCARRPVAHQLERVSVATRHAIRLELISAEEAASIWARARKTHPVLESRRLAA